MVYRYCQKHPTVRLEDEYGRELECGKCGEEWDAEADAISYAEKSLCLQCRNYNGDLYSGDCSCYPGMYCYMFGRKRKCKYFKEMKPDDFYCLDDGGDD